MSALFFPNLDALRLVLGGGIVPHSVDRAVASGRIDDHGRVWILPAELPAREILASLARLGIHVRADPPTPLHAIACWAELLPLRRSLPQPQPILAGIHLFELHASRASRLVATMRQLSAAPIGFHLLQEPGLAWITTARPPFATLLSAEEPASPLRVFTERGRGLWVVPGWEHPTPDRLVIPAGHVMLMHPEAGSTLREGAVPIPENVELPLASASIGLGRFPIPPAMTIAVSLVPRATSMPESVWVIPSSGIAEFWQRCRSAGEELLRDFEVASGWHGEEQMVVVRAKPGCEPSPFNLLAARGHYTDPRLGGLAVPAGFEIRPLIRPNELHRALHLAEHAINWVEQSAGGELRARSVPNAAFRPLAQLVRYTAAPTIYWEADRTRADAFGLAQFSAREDRSVLPDGDDDSEYKLAQTPVPTPPAIHGEVLGWLSRSLDRIASPLLRRKPSPTQLKPSPSPKPSPPPALRAEQQLASADILLHGQARAARRHELESQLLKNFPILSPEERGGRWADLASVYVATGNAADAAICWINAAWEVESPPTVWLDQWFRAECRVGKRSDADFDLARVLDEPARFGSARMVAAYIARSASALGGESQAALPRIVDFLDAHAADLPVRAAWLARLAIDRQGESDPLGMARWRDRLLARLRDKGPGLDLDEPSFLRFHGTATADRFQTAREWLGRARDPILAWIGRLNSGGKLQFAGLDPETECTAAYAQLLLAWGLGCLGERTRSRDWTARAVKTLTRARGRGVDQAVHRLLAELFASRIKDAQDGRAAKPGLPRDLPHPAENLPWLSRYAVDRLCDHSRILNPHQRTRAYRGLDVREFRGTDLLGERLHLFASSADAASLTDEARDLLAACDAQPTSATVPRVAFTLLEVAPLLEASVIPDVLALFIPALEWLETALPPARSEGERTERLPRYQSRLLETGFSAAAAFDQWAPARDAARYLARRIASGIAGWRRALGLASARIFRSLRKLGLRSEAEELLLALDPGRGEALPGTALTVDRPGLAVGWFAVGDDDAGTRILDEARNRLFLSGQEDDRDRTELAIAYAEALGSAPPRIALGRLEEIFQRLERVSVEGATNLYFTLKPLALIDAVVRSVVTEDFALGPVVRGWLDDDEFLIRRRIHRDMNAILREQSLPG